MRIRRNYDVAISTITFFYLKFLCDLLTFFCERALTAMNSELPLLQNMKIQ